MSERSTFSDSREEHPLLHEDVRHAPTQIPFRIVLAISVVSLVLGGLHFLATWVYFDWRGASLAENRSPRFPLSESMQGELPKEPRLEPLVDPYRSQGASLSNPRVPREEILRHYGDTESSDFVRVPIQHAMDALVERLPVRNPVPRRTFREGGLMNAGESNSGRLHRVPRESD